MKHQQYDAVIKQLGQYSERVLNSRELLVIGKQAAHHVGNAQLEAGYNERLQRLIEQSGVKHDNHNNG
jgi:hypothetical protein